MGYEEYSAMDCGYFYCPYLDPDKYDPYDQIPSSDQDLEIDENTPSQENEPI